MATYTLYTPAASFRAFSILIAAEYNGVDIQVDTNPQQVKKSPVGKLPALETPSGSIIFSSAAAARFVASLRRDTGLLGDNHDNESSLTDAAEIDAWRDWSATEVELPATVWVYPVAGYMPFYPEAYAKAKKDLANALEHLNSHLGSDKDFIIGSHITLADITVASTLFYAFKLVCDTAYLKPFPNVVRWFQGCVKQPEFMQVIGTMKMCEKELLAAKKPEGAKE